MKITMLILFIFCCLNNLAHSKDSIIVQSTTSTKNSGFYDFILPELKNFIFLKVNYLICLLKKVDNLKKKMFSQLALQMMINHK